MDEDDIERGVINSEDEEELEESKEHKIRIVVDGPGGGTRTPTSLDGSFLSYQNTASAVGTTATADQGVKPPPGGGVKAT